MPILEKESAKQNLGAYFETLNSIFESAFERYKQIRDRYDHTARSRASLIHDFIVAACEVAFSDRDDIRIRNFRGLFVLAFENHDIFMRFKKLDRKYRAANIPTQQTLDFEQQQLQLWPHLKQPTYLTAGYVPSNDWTKIERKAITCINGGELCWVLPIDECTTQQAEIIDLQHKTNTNKEDRIARVKSEYAKKRRETVRRNNNEEDKH